MAAAAVVVRPRAADGQPELVGLARRLAVERELAHAPRRAALVALGHPGVGDDEPAVVEHGVADVSPSRNSLSAVDRVGLELLERLREAVA